MTGLYARIAALEFEVTAVRLRPLSIETAVGWTRHSTEICLSGGGLEGVGEDISYEAEDQFALQTRDLAELRGVYTIESFSRRLDSFEMFTTSPSRTTNRLFRRWALESAALDLALRHAGQSLAGALQIEPAPLRYVVSLGLGEPPGTAPLQRVRALYPNAQFKVDLSPSWTEATVRELAAVGGVTTVDLKAHYHGSFEGPPANVDQYRAIAQGLPDVWIEDPAWSGKAWEVLAPYRDRVTFDAVLHSLADIEQLPVKPKCVNIKPSRFGFLSELFRIYEFCRSRGIAMYGGGQFELGAGRGQIQYLASLFHADADNDVAPSGFNEGDLANDLPTSPIAPRSADTGFAWK